MADSGDVLSSVAEPLRAGLEVNEQLVLRACCNTSREGAGAHLDRHTTLI